MSGETWNRREWARQNTMTRCTCQPPDEYFDCTLCACGSMHHYCECGRLTEPCDLDQPMVCEEA